jgi:hypothetical protein
MLAVQLRLQAGVDGRQLSSHRALIADVIHHKSYCSELAVQHLSLGVL